MTNEVCPSRERKRTLPSKKEDVASSAVERGTQERAHFLNLIEETCSSWKPSAAGGKVISGSDRQLERINYSVEGPTATCPKFFFFRWFSLVGLHCLLGFGALMNFVVFCSIGFIGFIGFYLSDSRVVECGSYHQGRRR